MVREVHIAYYTSDGSLFFEVLCEAADTPPRSNSRLFDVFTAATYIQHYTYLHYIHFYKMVVRLRTEDGRRGRGLAVAEVTQEVIGSTCSAFLLLPLLNQGRHNWKRIYNISVIVERNAV